MLNPKLVGFLRGLLYPLAMLLLDYVIQNLGGSGLVSGGTATIIVALLGMVEHAIQNNTGNAFFGAVKA